MQMSKLVVLRKTEGTLSLSSFFLSFFLSCFSQDHIPVPYQPDSSSNPSSTTSSTPSSPAPPLPPSATPPSPLHPSPQSARQHKPSSLTSMSRSSSSTSLWPFKTANTDIIIIVSCDIEEDSPGELIVLLTCFVTQLQNKVHVGWSVFRGGESEERLGSFSDEALCVCVCVCVCVYRPLVPKS